MERGEGKEVGGLWRQMAKMAKEEFRTGEGIEGEVGLGW
jgi:hypothetical protein